VDYQRERAISGIMGTLFDYLKDDAQYAGKIAEFKEKEVDLQFKLIEAQLKALGAWDEETQKIFEDAKKAAKEAAHAVTVIQRSYQKGETHVTDDIQKAMADAVQGWRSGIAQFADQTRALMLNSSLTGLTQQEQLAAAQGDFRRILALAQGGDTEALGQLDQARQAYLTIARTMFAGGKGFDAVWEETMGKSAELLAGARQTEQDVVKKAMADFIAGAKDNTQTLTTAIYTSAEQVAQAIYASIGGLPHYAEGGIATRPQLAVIGERGAEAVIPMRQMLRFPEMPRSSNLPNPMEGKVLNFGPSPVQQYAVPQASPAGGTDQATRAALDRLARNQDSMSASLAAIADSSAETARAVRSMARADRVRAMVAKRS
jgi:hypothetical protein